jgi:hypothetical protein
MVFVSPGFAVYGCVCIWEYGGACMAEHVLQCSWLFAGFRQRCKGFLPLLLLASVPGCPADTGMQLSQAVGHVQM